MGKMWARITLPNVDIDPVIAALNTHYPADEAALIESMLRELNGTVPDQQMMDEIGLALAIHRRSDPQQ